MKKNQFFTPLVTLLAFQMLSAVSASAGEELRPKDPATAPLPETTYERKTTWAETMVDVRTSTNVTNPTPGVFYGSAVATKSWTDFPHETDWLMQDSEGKMDDWNQGYRDGKLDITNYLQAKRDASLERKLIEKVLPECGKDSGEIKKKLNHLISKKVGPNDPRWLNLYVHACKIRRHARLANLLGKTKEILFARHHNLGDTFFAYTEYVKWAGDIHGGLFKLNLTPEAEKDGSFAEASPILKTDTGGTLRDPALSYDAKRLLFSWRKDKSDPQYQVYEMELATGKTRVIAGGGDTYGASYDPVYLPNGDILFNSTRVVQSVPCAGPDVSNFFICDKDGRFPRRIGFDQVHTLSPSVLDDGRVIYLRWDYNDRSQIYTQALFQMNSDGTGQTEYYGNNTVAPTTFFHPRSIPGSSKIMTVIGGHHGPQTGKLAIVDISKGRQGTDGVIEIPSGKKPTYRAKDDYAQVGDLYSYPFPLDNSSLLVSYDPIGRHMASPAFVNLPRLARETTRFHLYYMTIDGKRELLAADPRISSLKAIPVIARPKPTPRPATTDYRKNTGTFFMQDIYSGPGLASIPRGTVKKLRVVELLYREMDIGHNYSHGRGGSAKVSTPIAVGTGSWDVKAILGDTTVHEDGSAMFEVPARTPVYFQALNEKNQVIQTMRSWATLMPGETFSCVGCHENKNETPPVTGGISLAMKAGPAKLDPFYGPTRGFSFLKEIQPILNKHCTSCHNANDKTEAAKYILTDEPILDKSAQRNWARSYLTLTGIKPAEQTNPKLSEGRSNKWINWINNSSEATMLSPNSGGSIRSGLFPLLEKGHHDVKLSTEELDKLHAWVDLLVPFCGDYFEGNAWSEKTLKKAKQRLEMRKKADRDDLNNILEMLKSPKAK
jgi:hypothetical protein